MGMAAKQCSGNIGQYFDKSENVKSMSDEHTAGLW